MAAFNRGSAVQLLPSIPYINLPAKLFFQTFGLELAKNVSNKGFESREFDCILSLVHVSRT